MSQVTESQDTMLALMKEREREAYDRGRREEWAKAVKQEALAVREARKAALEELNTPEVRDFLEGVAREAAHQRERWGSEHDAGKTDADWFWLVGYLAGKALHKQEKRLHHLITTAAALFNWHLATLGKTNMRPGINGDAFAAAPAKETP